MTSAQCRGARGLLGWTVRDLAESACVHRNTVSNFETERFNGSAETVAAMRSALETAGVAFVDDSRGGPGVRLRK